MKQVISFGESLKSLRKAKGLTQKELANVFNIGQTSIANYEQGLRFPDSETLVKLADYFRVTLDELLARQSFFPNNNNAPLHKYTTTDLVLHTLKSLKSYNYTELAEYIDAAVGQTFSSLSIYEDIVTPLLGEIGTMWNRGDIGIHQEHVMSALVKDIISYVRTVFRPEKEPRGPRFLGLTAGGEDHTMGLLMLCNELYIQGWNSIFAGNSMPLYESKAAAATFKPDIVGISVTVPHFKDVALETAKEIHANFDVPVVIGGPGSWDADYFAPFKTAPMQLSQSIDFLVKIIDLKLDV